MTFYVHSKPEKLLVIEVLKPGWVWELWNEENRRVACSARSYPTQQECEEAIDNLKDAFQAQQIVARQPPY